MNPQQIIEVLKEDGATDKKSMLDALCDGEYLALRRPSHGWTQEQIENAFAFIKDEIE